METKQELNSLFQKFLKSNCSPAEVSLLLGYYHTDKIDILDELILEELENDESEVVAPPASVYEQIQQKMRRMEEGKVGRLRLRWVAAAAVAIVIFGAGWFINDLRKADVLVAGSGDKNLPQIRPGENKATLTLGNGRVIDLSSRKKGIKIGMNGASYTDGEALNELGAALGTQDEIFTAITPKGGTYEFILPDGSKVSLNAGTVFKFPSKFRPGQKRLVELVKGEAYFEIAKDRLRPFIVKSANQEVEVLGTEFNISNYEDDPTVATTLVEGSVKLKKQNAEWLLKPGDQAIDDAGTVKIEPVDVTGVIAWKEGNFRFNAEPMSSVAKKLERWYDVDISLSEAVAVEHFTGKISRNRSIRHVLDLMKETNRLHFKIEGRRIVIIEN